MWVHMKFKFNIIPQRCSLNCYRGFPSSKQGSGVAHKPQAAPGKAVLVSKGQFSGANAIVSHQSEHPSSWGDRCHSRDGEENTRVLSGTPVAFC